MGYDDPMKNEITALLLLLAAIGVPFLWVALGLPINTRNNGWWWW